MAEWTAAADVEGLFPVRAKSPAVHPSRQQPPPLSLQEQWQYIRESTARATTATRTNVEWFRKFVHRQHLGTRLRLVIAATVPVATWCYNAVRPTFVRAWKRDHPSRKSVTGRPRKLNKPRSLEADGTLEDEVRQSGVGQTARNSGRACLVLEELAGVSRMVMAEGTFPAGCQELGRFGIESGISPL